MTALTIDTLEVSRELQETGMDARQAEGVSQAIRRAQEQNLGELATKGDLELAKTELRSEINEAKVEIIKWVAALLIAQAGLIAALV